MTLQQLTYLLNQLRVHSGPVRDPLRGLRPRCGIAGPCAQRDHLEAGSRDLRRPVRRRARPVQSGGENRGRHGIPSVPDRQRHPVTMFMYRRWNYV